MIIQEHLSSVRKATFSDIETEYMTAVNKIKLIPILIKIRKIKRKDFSEYKYRLLLTAYQLILPPSLCFLDIRQISD